MNVHVLQHVPFEDIGSMSAWFRECGVKPAYTRFFEDPALPGPEGLDLVVAMGGPMSVNDEAEFPWLAAEKRFLREVVGRGVPALGICLGAQLVASALGSRVHKNPVKEIGWFPVEATPGAEGTFAFPDRHDVFHWHGETFDLPDGAVLLARSEACGNQAFQLGRHVIGMQFHLETTPRCVQALIEHCGDELAPGPYIQSRSEMLAVPAETYEKVNRLMGRALEYLTRGRGAAG